MKNLLFACLLIIGVTFSLKAESDPFISGSYSKGSFTIAKDGKASPILISNNDYKGVLRAASDLQTDIEKVTGVKPVLKNKSDAAYAIIIGTIGHNEIIDQLIRDNKINVAGIAGRWESTLIEVVKNPLPNVDSALVIVGSDKRGTIYGIYEVSYQIGVSPWYYWADVPVKRQENIYALPGRHLINSPAVKYRGIFLNDEAPALSGWAGKEFGGFNHQFYEKVFELILRLKGNYLWPAMWGSAFNDDDKLNPVKAEEYGIVIGTSHHEPLTRAHDEWKRYGSGEWDYSKNPEKLKEFWESGLKRTIGNEQVITIGMRGDGDEPMTQGTATALLEKIVSDQREIIEKVSGKPASETPQVWALYKEVQDYYEKGMRVPDDVTLLLCDDNWGNLRMLPKLNEAPRKGGYGIYYHFDYVGGPRNYKWINTNPIQKIWEQMNLAYRYDANQLWIVNVGDLKPMEFPIEFFLDYAWNPDALPFDRLMEYTIKWADKQFGEKYAPQIGDLLNKYTQYNGRIKPELLNEKTYSLVNYNEFSRVVNDYNRLVDQANFIYNEIPAEQKDAFYQLVLHPIQASANLNELYYTVAKNHLYAKQGRNSTNKLSLKVTELFKKDSTISHYYNKILANGKWDHMMDQTHISYTYWQQPPVDVVPKTEKIEIAENGEMGVAIEGSETSWTGTTEINEPFPIFYSITNESHYLELFNKGAQPITYTIQGADYINISHPKGQIDGEQKVLLSINWDKAPKGVKQSALTIEGSDHSVVTLPIQTNNTDNNHAHINIFVEQNGYVSIEGVNYSKAVDSRPIFWKALNGYGKTSGGMTTFPVTASPEKLTKDSPHLEYEIYLNNAGVFTLNSYISPTIDFTNSDGLKFAVSIDDEEPVIVNISEDYKNDRAWGKSVADNIKILKTKLSFNKAGKHTIKYWMVDAAVVLQKLVLDTGGLKYSFLGPEETFVSNP